MQQNQICAICERQPEDLLVLACQHNLCVSCATEIYTLNGGQNPFVCEICLAQTELDEETVSHFQSQTQRYPPKQQKKQKQKQKKKPKPPKSKSPQKKAQVQNNCHIHNQPALYYCFNCNAVDICSECILTPKHANHKVLTLKKAMIGFQKKIEDELRACDSIRSQLQGQKQKIIQGKEDLRQSFEDKKQDIKQIFDEIARTVSEKYADLCSKLEEDCGKGQKIFDACLMEIEEKQRILQHSIRIQQRAYQNKSEYALAQMMESIGSTKQMYYPNIPKQLPICSIQLHSFESIGQEVRRVLDKMDWNKETEAVLVDYSMIRQANEVEQIPRTALKESCRKSVNINRSNNRISSCSRKLDLSRSIQNATYIINKLQQRSKNA